MNNSSEEILIVSIAEAELVINDRLLEGWHVKDFKELRNDMICFVLIDYDEVYECGWEDGYCAGLPNDSEV